MSGIPTLDDIEDTNATLRIRGHLDEIGEINDEVIGTRQGFPMSRKSYEWALSAVALCAGVEEVDEVADFIKEQFQGQFPDRPSSRKVRRNARRIVKNNGYEPHPFLDV